MYFKEPLHYIKTKFPIKCDTVCNSVWIDVTYRLGAFWKKMQHFVDKFQSVRSLEGINKDNLHEEFVRCLKLSLNYFILRAFQETEIVDGVVGDGEEAFQCQTDTLR